MPGYCHPSRPQPDFTPEAGAGPTGRSAEAAVRELEDRVNRLAMTCCAMWTVIQAHSNVTDDQLINMVAELDLSDGAADGRAGVEQVNDCPSCARPVAVRHLRCMYCGTPRRPSNPFEGVL